MSQHKAALGHETSGTTKAARKQQNDNKHIPITTLNVHKLILQTKNTEWLNG